MKNKIKNTLISFIFLGVIGLLTSCPNPNTANEPKSTVWSSVNQSEVDKLLDSPEEIEFEDKKLKLYVSYTKEVYRTGRGCGIFPCARALSSAKDFNFRFDYEDDYNKEFNKRISATSLYIINKETKYYYYTKDIKKNINNDYNDYSVHYTIIPPIDYDNENKNNIGIVKFESKDKTFYVKGKVFNR